MGADSLRLVKPDASVSNGCRADESNALRCCKSICCAPIRGKDTGAIPIAPALLVTSKL